MQRFLQRDHDVGFDIAPALGHGPTLPEPAEGRPATTPTEECFEKIAEPGAAELKFDTTVFPAAPAKSAGLPAAPLWWRLKSAGLIPILAQLTVFPALFRIAYDFVGLADRFKFFFRRLLVLCNVRMVFSGVLSILAPACLIT